MSRSSTTLIVKEAASSMTTTRLIMSEAKASGAAASNKHLEAQEYFKMPLHYPKYTMAQYEAMSEAQLECLLNHYGLPCHGTLEEKRKDAMGHFLWSVD